MSAGIPLESLFGAYNPEEPSPWWIQSFLGSNILAVCDQLIPGEKVQCVSSDTLYLGYPLLGDRIISYVPVSCTGKVIHRGSDEKVDTHYFITRPESIREFAKASNLEIDKPNGVALILFWDTLLRQIRAMIQVKFANQLTYVSFSTLLVLNVDLRAVASTQQAYVGASRSGGLKGDDLVLCMDQFCIATCGIVYIARAIREGDVDVLTLPTIVAQTSALGL